MRVKTLLHSRALPRAESGTQVAITPRRAGWEYVGFAVRRIGAGDTCRGRSGGEEMCLVLLSGLASVTWSGDRRGRTTLGTRRDGFSECPHAVDLPRGTGIGVLGRPPTGIAQRQLTTTV